MNKKTCLILCLLTSFMLAGCGPAHSSKTYSRREAGQVQTVEEGEVLFVREVEIEGSKTGLGGIAGGVMGYAVGSAIGGGSGKKIARAGGAIGGAVAGAAVEEKATREMGLEITVQLESGEVIAIVQSADEQFDEGDLVRVLRRPDGVARVIQ